MSIQQHRVAACHQERSDKPGVTLDGHRCVKVLQIFVLNLALAGFNACPQVMKRDVLAIHFDPTAEDEAVDFVALISNKREGCIGPAVHGAGLLLPARTTKLEDVVIDVQGKRDVEVVRPNGRVWALCLCGFEVQEADLVPQERANVSLERCQAVCGAVAEAVDADTLGEADECPNYHACCS